MLQDWISGVIGAIVIVVGYISLDGATLQWALTIAGIALIVNSLWSVSGRVEVNSRRVSKN